MEGPGGSLASTAGPEYDNDDDGERCDDNKNGNRDVAAGPIETPAQSVPPRPPPSFIGADGDIEIDVDCDVSSLGTGQGSSILGRGGGGGCARVVGASPRKRQTVECYVVPPSPGGQSALCVGADGDGDDGERS